MAEKEIPDHANIDSFPVFVQKAVDTYGIELPPFIENPPSYDLPEGHSLYDIWSTPGVTVSKGTSPNPRYRARGDISDKFPFNFAQSAELEPVMSLTIDLFESDTGFQSLRGVKVTVFHVPDSTEVIVSYTKDVPSEVQIDMS